MFKIIELKKFNVFLQIQCKFLPFIAMLDKETTFRQKFKFEFCKIFFIS